ncbi:MAG: hypothetical protein RIS94_1405 [Pseudomonadota bacterium]|jgi:RNA polymerase sigma-70 factor (ECF subfamily)
MASFAAMTDGGLAQAVRTGAKAAFGELMRRHREFVFRIARGQTGNDDDALDVTQQAFVAAFAAIDRYDGTRPFTHWIARIAINRARDLHRRRKVRHWLSRALPLDAATHVPDEAPDIAQVLDDRAALSRTMRLIAALPAPLKDVLVLRTLTGLDEAETAAVLGLSRKTVETRLYRARNRLREKLPRG